ncbi:L,D-transpeptidase [Paraburkholderia sp. GAS334]|jgi:hypothetical protein|uniref:L,D-transpeptidase n=1 Tax=Paraburkholderia sp. GAS334 TaxID=3035131 RepID=UPI003D248CF2
MNIDVCPDQASRKSGIPGTAGKPQHNYKSDHCHAWIVRLAVAGLCGLSCVAALAAGSTPAANVSNAASLTPANPLPASSAPSSATATATASAPASAASAPPPARASVAPPNAGVVVDPRRALLMRDAFAREVTRRLKVPAAEQAAYGARLQAALAANDSGGLSGEYVVLVDRSANVQALFIYFRAAPADKWQMIGASPVATGRPGEFDHFITPLGVFEHTPDNMDFRAEGTMNQNGIRGYGKHDMRIFDLGWADGERGWGKGGVSQMRFQMHATDPDRLEPLLGIRHSKGCVRIPASLNVFLDHHGILDAEYEALVASGASLWVLHSDRQMTPWAGRYIVVVDSQRKARPAWSPAPGSTAHRKLPAGGDTAD